MYYGLLYGLSEYEECGRNTCGDLDCNVLYTMFGRNVRIADCTRHETVETAIGEAITLDGPDEGTCIVGYRSPRMASESITWTNAYPGWLPGHEIITCEIADLSTA